MKNLAGVKDCDDSIIIELQKAKANILTIGRNSGEVKYSLIGQVKNWTLTRAWYYWIAIAEDKKGIPLKEASEMHETKYPDEHFDEHREISIYGNVIRVGGHCGCPHPKDFGERDGSVNCYHIDSQEGLNEFVRRIKNNNSIWK